MSARPPDVYEQLGVAMTCRSFQEYLDMFDLPEANLARGRILDVAAGASSFVAEAAHLGYQAMAADPLYSLSPSAIFQRGIEEIREASGKLASLKHVYDWSYYGSLEAHERLRVASLERFVRDYEAVGKTRYVNATLPNLPFEEGQFTTVLCSHFLFLYEAQFDFNFHLDAILNLARLLTTDGELRVYPTSGLNRKPYAELSRLQEALAKSGFYVDRVETPFRFLKSATTILCVRRHGD